MPPLIKKWNMVADNDKSLCPLFGNLKNNLYQNVLKVLHMLLELCLNHTQDQF